MIVDKEQLREKVRVFADRDSAGNSLAEMLSDYDNCGGIVMAIPAGGVPVGAAVAKKLDLELDLAVVSKALLPWNTEAGFGAVAFDGSIKLNETMVKQSGLSDEQIEKQVSAAKQKVQRRMRDLRGKRNLPNLEGRTVFLLDDGIASGFTMLVAAEAIRAHQPGELIIAVPTAHGRAIA